MQNDLDMNSYRILNLPSATQNSEPVTYGQWSANIQTVEFTGYLNETLTATDGQTVFTLVNAYTVGIGAIRAYINGVYQAPSAYTETDANTITFSEGLDAGDQAAFVISSFDAAAATGANNITYTPAGVGAVATNVQTKLREFVSVKDFGAQGDNVTDDTAAIQAAIDAIEATEPAGAGVLFFPKGNYRTSGPITIPSHITLEGEGKTSTYIRPLNSATFTTAEGVIMTEGFTEDADLWDYYSAYPAGLKMGVHLRNLCIDGNRANVANAHGLMIYGGQWVLENLAVINCSGHGIWTEAGSTGSSTSGDDLHDFLNMHEAYALNIYIANADQHGWLYRGPNDSHIDGVQIKTCGWGAFIQETEATISTGNLEIGSMHAYACDCAEPGGDDAMFVLQNANVDFLYIDSSYKNGLVCKNAVFISKLYGHANGMIGTVGQGNYWTAIADTGSSMQVGILRTSTLKNVTTGTLGGHLWVKDSTYCNFGNVRMFEAPSVTVANIGIKIDSIGCHIGGGVIQSFDQVGGVGLELNASGCNINLDFSACNVGVDYNNSGVGRNRLDFNFISCTTDLDIATTVADSDSIRITSDTGNTTDLVSQNRVGRIQFPELSTTPTNPSIGAEGNVYVKADKLVIQFNDSGTIRYKYLDLTGTGVTWTHTTTPP
jgi:hypothetical protein